MNTKIQKKSAFFHIQNIVYTLQIVFKSILHIFFYSRVYMCTCVSIVKYCVWRFYSAGYSNNGPNNYKSTLITTLISTTVLI